MRTLAVLFSLVVAGAAWSQSIDPMDAFTRLRTGDPGFGPATQGVGTCFDCHKFTRTSASTPGGHGNVYRSVIWMFDVDTSALTLVRRFAPTPTTLPTNYRIRKHSPIALFGDALADPTLGGVTDNEIIFGGAQLGRAHFVESGLKVGRYGWQGCCRTLDCQTRAAMDQDFDITEAEQQSQNIHAPSGMTWQQFYDWEAGLLVQAIQDFDIPAPAPPAFLQESFDRGEATFAAIGCADCHRQNVPLPSGGTFSPYTDWRLHQKRGEGKGVATCGDAKGNEVMTPSLVSRRNFLGRDFNVNPSIKQDVIRMLHNIDDAKPSVEQYLQLPDADRSDVDTFLEFL